MDIVPGATTGIGESRLSGPGRPAAAKNSPPGSEKRPESVGVSPPLRGDFMGYAAFGGAL